MSLLLVLLLAAITLFFISLERSYGFVPEIELKKRARMGDEVAAALYKAAAYGSSLRLLLRSLIVGWSALLFLFIAREMATWLAFLTIGFVLWLGFIWLPARRATDLGLRFAKLAAPLLARLLSYLHPFTQRFIAAVQRRRPVTIHTGLYDVDDLKQLFERQKVQSDNRINIEVLNMAHRVLSFGDMAVRDVLIPRRVVKSVKAGDSIGPLLLDDLHKSGHSRFPVFDGESVAGILMLRRAVRAKAGGLVRSTMNKQVCYVHEDQPVAEALQAIIRTHQQLFIVVNSFEEYVGILTMEDVIEAVLGTQIVDEFDEYDDLRAVAAKMAKIEHAAHEPKFDDDVQPPTEVVQ